MAALVPTGRRGQVLIAAATDPRERHSESPDVERQTREAMQDQPFVPEDQEVVCALLSNCPFAVMHDLHGSTATVMLNAIAASSIPSVYNKQHC